MLTLQQIQEHLIHYEDEGGALAEVIDSLIEHNYLTEQQLIQFCSNFTDEKHKDPSLWDIFLYALMTLSNCQSLFGKHTEFNFGTILEAKNSKDLLIALGNEITCSALLDGNINFKQYLTLRHPQNAALNDETVQYYLKEIAEITTWRNAFNSFFINRKSLGCSKQWDDATDYIMATRKKAQQTAIAIHATPGLFQPHYVYHSGTCRRMGNSITP